MKIEGQTNVRSSRFGRGAVDGLGKSELGRFLVATMPIPWDIVRDRLEGTPEAVLMVESMEIDMVERLLDSAPECDTVVGIGGGQAVDLAKYFSWKKKVRLVSIPTVVSVDAFVTPAAAIRRQHRVEYLGESSPDPLVIDYDVIRTAPAPLNIAGAGDLLSIHTATFDWELAEAAGKSEYSFSADAVAEARRLLEFIVSKSDAIRAVSDEGIQAIVDGYLWLNTICLPAGHYRVEEGSEHFLFYELEERLGRPFIHGHIIGLGIHLLSRLQGNRPEWITEVMQTMNLDHQPADLEISRADLEASLANLAQYVRKAKLWYSVIDDRPITPAWIAATLDSLRFA